LESDKKTNAFLFVASLEQSFITVDMIEEMLVRWSEIGKPLFMIPKDFKERILLNIDQEVKLNYLKWLTQGLEIDMFEMLSVLIVYTRGSLEQRLALLFRLCCYDDQPSMQHDEFKFMLDKLCTSVGSTLFIKKTFLLEM